MNTVQAKTGDILDGTLPEVSHAKVVSVANNQQAFLKVDFLVDVETLIPGDGLVFSFFRDGSGTNPDDTYVGNVVVSQFTVTASFFTP